MKEIYESLEIGTIQRLIFMEDRLKKTKSLNFT